ncbi:hypothetical protein KCP69_25095 [Salmonella enterica subsp. enterica]|nr:hypothetical protein KCP69_25095 [Salmonella enterica subsp. enterica]
MITRAFRVKFNGGDSSLYVATAEEERDGKVVAIQRITRPTGGARDYQYHSDYEESTSSGTLAHWCKEKRR